MIVNVRIELDDAARCALADLMDGKRTKRLIKRAEVVKILQDHIAELTARTAGPGPFAGIRDDWQTPGPSGPATRERAAAMRRPPFQGADNEVPEDERELVAELESDGRSPSYIRGQLAVFRRVRGRCSKTGRVIK